MVICGLLFIDDCSQMTWLCLMKSKDEVNFLFEKFLIVIGIQYDVEIQVPHSNNGVDYQSHNL